MNLRPSSPPQELLFDLHPIGTEPPVAHRTITPGCLLPAADNKFIDVARACSILGVTKPVVLRMRKLHYVSGYQLYDDAPVNIEYASIVQFCDQLRIDYDIADRRTRRSRDGRWRDVDLLPFPLADTVDTTVVMTGLSKTRQTAIHMCEEGRFECYRLMSLPNSPWRISKTSLFAFRDRLIADMKQRSPSFARR